MVNEIQSPQAIIHASPSGPAPVKKGFSRRILLILVITIGIILAVSVGNLYYQKLAQPKQLQHTSSVPTITDHRSTTDNKQLVANSMFYDFSITPPKKIVLVVDKSTYQMIKVEIDRFANDIATDLNAGVKILDNNYGSPSKVKSALIQEKNNNGDFQGVIFIGDIPPQYIRTKNTGQSPAVSDSWYLDLEERNLYAEKINNECKDPNLVNPEGKCITSYFEVESGFGYKTISRWSGRITPTLGKSDRTGLLKRYFVRNHDYRRGNLKYEGALIYGPDPSLNACTQYEKCFLAADKHFVDETHITTKDKLSVIAAITPDENTEAEYLSKQKEPFRFQLVNAHGGTTSFKSGIGKISDMVTYSELIDNNPGALFSIFLSCSVGAFDVKDNLASAYIFEGKGLAAYSASLPIFTQSPFEPTFSDISYFILGSGGRLYEAFNTRHHFNILGDPTVRIKEPSKEGCKLVFDTSQTGVNFNLRISEKGVENSEEYKKQIKIKNVGSDTCYISFAEVVHEEWSSGFSYSKPKEKIDPGEIVEFEISPAILSYTSDEWGVNQTVSSLAFIKFVTNGLGYLNSIPVKVSHTKI